MAWNASSWDSTANRGSVLPFHLIPQTSQLKTANSLPWGLESLEKEREGHSEVSFLIERRKEI